MPLPPDLSKPVFQLFPRMADRVINGVCTSCAEFIESDEFNDELSAKEFSISGMCQSCQDTFFQPYNEDEEYEVEE